MYYGEIKARDIADGPGVRVGLFVSGCTNRCEGCFQPQTWDFQYGRPFTEETEERILSLLSPPYMAGLTVLGGEPFEPSNQRALLPFLRRVRENCPGKTIWCYTGFLYEALRGEGGRPAASMPSSSTCETLRGEGGHPRCEATDPLLDLLDVLVDGPFVLAEKEIGLRFRGSRNQRLIDLRATRERGRLILLPDRRR